MNIHACKGCFGGGKNLDSPCVQKDDMDKIYPVYKEVDIVVLATPLYYWTISGQLKCAFDCGKCLCVFNDKVNELLAKMDEYDGMVVGSPIYYAGSTGQICSFLDRLFLLVVEKWKENWQLLSFHVVVVELVQYLIV